MPLSFLPVILEGRSIALPAGHVLQIIGAQPWVALPQTRKELPGVCAWRGRAIAVLDIAAMSEGRRLLAPGEIRSRTVIAGVNRVTLALPVDGVHEVRSVDDDAISPRRLTDQAFARREVRIDGAIAAILDLEALVSDLVAGVAL